MGENFDEQFGEGFNLPHYQDEKGKRVLKGLCDELFEHLLKGKPWTCEKIRDCWRRQWYISIPGLGKVWFQWIEEFDHGREWLKEKDKKYQRALKELSYVNKDNIDVQGDIIWESSSDEEDFQVVRQIVL